MKNLTKYSDLLAIAATQFHLPPLLLEAQCFHESAGDADAFRYEPRYFLHYIKGNTRALGYPYRAIAACSIGLMQIMVETAFEQGFRGRPEDLFDPSTNIQLGAKKMQALWDWAGGRDGDYGKALAAYNEGPGNAQSGPPFVDQVYVDAIYALAKVPPNTAELGTKA